MIDRDRLTARFLALTAIDAPSRGEAALCRRLKEELAALGLTPEEDGTAERIGGTAGNLYTWVPGTRALPPLLLSAHMDTVEPSRGKRAVLQPDGRISSDGTTVLGADDVSGLCAILEALTSVREDGAAHRPVEILFDAAEETYCTGIQCFDFARLRSRECYVFDLSGPVGSAAHRAPAILSFRAEFRGRSAHAAFAPETGIHAIRAAAQAVAAVPCGRVGDTTVNVGTIAGGTAANVVPDRCTVTGEIRSFRDASAQAVLAQLRETMERAAADHGAAVTVTSEVLCRAYRTDPDGPAAARFRAACAAVGLTPTLTETYGGSDNNHFAQHGISGLVVASGMEDCHSCREHTSVQELERAARLAEALILSEL